MLDPASTTPTAQLRCVELCYRYAYLEGRRGAGRPLETVEEKELAYLRHLLQGDTPIGELHSRRGSRRFPLMVRAVVKTREGWSSALVLNVSGEGMYLLATRHLELGERVQVKLGRVGEVEYIFTCAVRRSEQHDALCGVGLSFSCVPLEMRRARSAA
jgi:hypothetical protein